MRSPRGWRSTWPPATRRVSHPRSPRRCPGGRRIAAPPREPLRAGHVDASLDPVAGVLEDLVEIHAVSNHEWEVRRYVLEALPGWAKERAVVDGIGNVWVAAGPDRDTTVFMAHMDEVGFEVAAIAPDGIVALERAGTTALLLAIRELDPETLDHTVIFAWSVNEEGGLVGAAAMARRFGATARRIYSVDTFVSSDTPLESPHFAYTPLGAGPVLRAIESSGVSPDRERRRVERIAEEAGIPLQMGLTQGGTDGTEFTYRGAPNQGLSWPGRYSHSPGEVLDLRDLTRLSELIVAVARAGEGAGTQRDAGREDGPGAGR